MLKASNNIERRRILQLGLGAGVLAAAPRIGAAANAKAARISVMTSPSGSGPYNAWATLQTYAPDYSSRIYPVAVETPGFTYNVEYVAKTPSLWKNTVFGSGTALQWAAVHGVKPFFPEALAPVRDFRLLGAFSGTSIVWATLDKSIKTPVDFAGKRIATGLLTQNEWGMYERMFLDWWGITPKLREFEPLGTTSNVQAMLDGRADVSTLVVFTNHDMSQTLLPGPFHTLEAAHRQWWYVDIPKDMITKETQKFGAPFLIRHLRPGTMPKQSGEITTFGETMPMSAHKSFPDELAYEFVKLWIKMGPAIAKYTAISKIWDPKTISMVARESPALVHPGAMKAYRELGLA